MSAAPATDGSSAKPSAKAAISVQPDGAPKKRARTSDKWRSAPERGSMWWLHVIAWIYRQFGRRVCLAILHVVAFYFVVFAGAARRASRDYQETLWAIPRGRAALDAPPSFRSVWRHIHEFSINIFDRLVAWSGDIGEIDFEHRGSDILLELAKRGGGGLLIGAHQGSFDMMRLLADQQEITVNVLMFTQHATRINAFFEQLDPNSRVRVLEIQPGSLKTAFAVRECIARGEFVGILGDRIPPGARDRPAYVEFLGRRTAFSLSPFVLASVLGCPVVHTQCIRVSDRAYESSATVLSDFVDSKLPRRQKADALLRLYVAQIEATCYRSPYQWFNFFDYWGDRGGGDA